MGNPIEQKQTPYITSIEKKPIGWEFCNGGSIQFFIPKYGVEVRAFRPSNLTVLDLSSPYGETVIIDPSTISTTEGIDGTSRIIQVVSTVGTVFPDPMKKSHYPVIHMRLGDANPPIYGAEKVQYFYAQNAKVSCRQMPEGTSVYVEATYSAVLRSRRVMEYIDDHIILQSFARAKYYNEIYDRRHS